jgi:hypothetical protein
MRGKIDAVASPGICRARSGSFGDGSLADAHGDGPRAGTGKTKTSCRQPRSPARRARSAAACGKSAAAAGVIFSSWAAVLAGERRSVPFGEPFAPYTKIETMIFNCFYFAD